MAKAVSLSADGRKAGLERSVPAWSAQKPARPETGFLRRLLRRKEPSTYQRCLALHMYFAGRPSGLSDG